VVSTLGASATIGRVTDRRTALEILAALRQSPVADTAVLIGSSGLFGFETNVPALTEDVDVAIPEELVAQHGPEIVEALLKPCHA
jgi:hypothetical protein